MLTIKRGWFPAALVLIILVLGIGCQGTGEEGPDLEAEETVEEKMHESIEAKGVFVGQIDSQSVEIEIDGRTQAFGLEEGLSVVKIDRGMEVSITYYETEGRPILERIEMLEEPDQVLEGEGIYNGMADSRSVEIDVDDRVRVFTIDSGVDLEGLTEGSIIGFTYKEREPRPLLLSVEVIEKADPDENEEDEEAERLELEGKGIFVGQIDTQSVEIVRTRVFELGENVRVEGIDDGSEVAFDFKETEQRPVLETIEAVDEPLEGEIIHGTFIGQVDSNSVEIEYHQAYALGPGVSAEGIEEGAEVTFAYSEGLYRPELTALNTR